MEEIRISYNQKISKILAYIVLIPLFTNFFGSMLNSMGFSTQISTYVIYAVIVIYEYYTFLTLNSKLFLKSFLVQTIILIAFCLNYLFFKESQIYFEKNIIQLAIIIIIYIPAGVFMTKLDTCEYFFESIKFSVFVTPIAGILAFYVFNVAELMNYMVFSYMILPGCLANYYFISKNQGNKLLLIACFLVDLYLLLIYGGRMAFISVIAFVVLSELLKRKYLGSANKFVLFLILAIILCLGIYFYNLIIDYLKSVLEPYRYQSRIIDTFIRGEFLSSNEAGGRETIYMYTKKCLSEMGFGMGGFFGDRIALAQYMSHVSYQSNHVHNFFYEIWLSFGWIFGTVIISWVVFKTIKGFLQKNQNSLSEFILFFFCIEFMRLCVSGSYLIEGLFVFFICSLLLVKKNNENEFDNGIG